MNHPNLRSGSRWSAPDVRITECHGVAIPDYVDTTGTAPREARRRSLQTDLRLMNLVRVSPDAKNVCAIGAISGSFGCTLRVTPPHEGRWR